MIVVENRLAEAFDQLPNVLVTTDPVFAGYKPVFRWGNQMHLIEVLKRYGEGNETPYPLIYQTSNKSSQDSHAMECTTKLSLVIATRNTEKDLLNENRWALSYANILFPVVENIEKAFRRAQIFTWDGKYDVYEFPNYGSGEENFTQDIWDAVLFETNININANCINEINFN